MENQFSNAERAEVLTQALPYIKKHTGKIIVIKYGGNAMINEQLKQQVMEDIVLFGLSVLRLFLFMAAALKLTTLWTSSAKSLSLLTACGLPIKKRLTLCRWCLRERLIKPL